MSEAGNSILGPVVDLGLHARVFVPLVEGCLLIVCRASEESALLRVQLLSSWETEEVERGLWPLRRSLEAGAPLVRGQVSRPGVSVDRGCAGSVRSLGEEGLAVGEGPPSRHCRSPMARSGCSFWKGLLCRSVSGMASSLSFTVTAPLKAPQNLLGAQALSQF